jgi:ADP-ribosylation factor GTPase-activating protein 1
VAALGKGWSVFSSAVVGATRTVNSTVIQPTVERVSDPSFRAGMTQYVSDSAKSANAWGKSQLGVDVGTVVENLASGVTGAGRGAYSSLAGGHGHHGFDDDEGTSALYADASDDNFLRQGTGSAGETSKTPQTPGAQSTAPQKKKDNWDDNEWKDF